MIIRFQIKKQDLVIENFILKVICSCECANTKKIYTVASNLIYTISGDNGVEVPPVPIPNTEVKLNSAESTWLDTAWEDRSSPDFISLTRETEGHSSANLLKGTTKPPLARRETKERETSEGLYASRAYIYSSLAQSVEPAAVNRVVVGSSPTGGAKKS